MRSNKEREERIDSLKAQLAEVSEAYDKADTQLTKTTTQLQMITSKFEAVSDEYANTVEKLRKINQARNEKEQKLSQEKRANALLTKQVAESSQNIRQRDAKIEDLNGQIKAKDKEISRSHFEYDSLEKRTTSMIKQLNDRLSTISEVLKLEQQSSGDLSGKYEAEKKGRIQAETELVTVKTQNRDMEFKIRDITAQNQILQAKYDKLINDLTQTNQKYESLISEFNAKVELLKQVEINNDHLFTKQKEENDKAKTQLMLQIARQEMFSEDMISRLDSLHHQYSILDRDHQMLLKIESENQKEIEDLESANKTKDELILDLQSQISKYQEEVNQAKEQITSLSSLVESLKNSKQISDDKAELFKTKLTQKLEEINHLKNHINQLENEMKQRLINASSPVNNNVREKVETQTNISPKENKPLSEETIKNVEQIESKEKEDLKLQVVRKKTRVIKDTKQEIMYQQQSDESEEISEVEPSQVPELLEKEKVIRRQKKVQHVDVTTKEIVDQEEPYLQERKVQQQEITIQEQETIIQKQESYDLFDENDIMVSFDNSKRDNIITYTNQIENDFNNNEFIQTNSIFDEIKKIEENGELDENKIDTNNQFEKIPTQGFNTHKDSLSKDINPFIIQKKNIASRKSATSSDQNSFKSENQLTAKLPSIKSNIQSSKSSIQTPTPAALPLNPSPSPPTSNTIGLSTDMTLLDPIIHSILLSLGYSKKPPSKMHFTEDLPVSSSIPGVLAQSKSISDAAMSSASSNITPLQRSPEYGLASSLTPPFLPMYSTEDRQNTQVSEDLLNTSTEMAPSLSTSPFLQLNSSSPAIVQRDDDTDRNGSHEVKQDAGNDGCSRGTENSKVRIKTKKEGTKKQEKNLKVKLKTSIGQLISAARTRY